MAISWTVFVFFLRLWSCNGFWTKTSLRGERTLSRWAGSGQHAPGERMGHPSGGCGVAKEWKQFSLPSDDGLRGLAAVSFPTLHLPFAGNSKNRTTIHMKDVYTKLGVVWRIPVPEPRWRKLPTLQQVKEYQQHLVDTGVELNVNPRPEFPSRNSQLETTTAETTAAETTAENAPEIGDKEKNTDVRMQELQAILDKIDAQNRARIG